MSDKQLAQLKQCLQAKYSHVNISKLSSNTLVRALYSRNLVVEDAAELVVKYVTSAKENQLCFNLDIRNPKTKNAICTCRLLNAKTCTGEYVFVTKLIEWNPDETNQDEWFAILNFMFESISRNPNVIKAGIWWLIDSKNIGWKHFKAMKPGGAYHFLRFLANHLPCNAKRIVFYDSNWAMDMFTKALKPLLPKNISDMLLITSSTDQKGEKLLGRPAMEEIDFSLSVAQKDAFFKEIMARADDILAEWKFVQEVSQTQ